MILMLQKRNDTNRFVGCLLDTIVEVVKRK